MIHLEPPNFGLDNADYYVMADINLKTGKATFEQAELIDTPMGVMAECRTYSRK